jgi:hypothetical protein
MTPLTRLPQVRLTFSSRRAWRHSCFSRPEAPAVPASSRATSAPPPQTRDRRARQPGRRPCTASSRRRARSRARTPGDRVGALGDLEDALRELASGGVPRRRRPRRRRRGSREEAAHVDPRRRTERGRQARSSPSRASGAVRRRGSGLRARSCSSRGCRLGRARGRRSKRARRRGVAAS